MPTPIWFAGVESPKYAPLDKDLHVDVAIIGGGITGATTAYLLKQAGLKVAVLEKGRCANGETGHTSAHLTYVTDQRLHALVETFGRDTAHAVWTAGQAALLQIEQLVRSLGIDCEFARVPGYLHSPKNGKATGPSECDLLHCDAELAANLGFAATFVDSVPFLGECGVRYADQAVFHPVKYVTGLLQHVVGGGGHVFEESPVDEVGEGRVIHCRNRKVTCDHVVIATHNPIACKQIQSQAAYVHSRVAAYNTYVISGHLPKGSVQPALYWDTSSPYRYLRFQEQADHVLVILGGEDHKTGQMKNTTEPFQRLESIWSELLPDVRVGKHWSGQVINANDGLPLIGELADNYYVATAFAGNGLTFGTFSAMLLRDLIVNIANPWWELFRPDRTVLEKGLWTYLKEGLDFPRYYLQDRLTGAEATSIDDVPIGAGRIVQMDGEKVAVYRDAANHVSCHSAICTHMGCIVHWNTAERTWDCPCHGSRFLPDGKVMAGPAQSPLEEHAATHSES